MPLFKNVSVVSYHVKDWQAARKFYAMALEWPVIYANDELGWMEFGTDAGAHIAISRWDEHEPMPPVIGGGTAVLTVDDAVEATAQLRARGIRCDDAVNIPGAVCYGAFYDPEGNRIQFASNAQ